MIRLKPSMSDKGFVCFTPLRFIGTRLNNIIKYVHVMITRKFTTSEGCNWQGPAKYGTTVKAIWCKQPMNKNCKPVTVIISRDHVACKFQHTPYSHDSHKWHHKVKQLYVKWHNVWEGLHKIISHEAWSRILKYFYSHSLGYWRSLAIVSCVSCVIFMSSLRFL